MRPPRALLAACTLCAASSTALAQQPSAALPSTAQPSAALLHADRSPAAAHPIVLPQQVQRQPRDVHPDYGSLSAGLVLFGFSYGLALSEPLRHGFSDDTRQRAIPVAGPWLSSVTWAWALDGVLQLGGIAFVTNAFVNPVCVLGTPVAASSPSARGERYVSIAGSF